MKRRITISGILLFLAAFVFGQNTQLKIHEKNRQSGIKNHFEVLKREGNKVKHNPFQRFHGNLIQRSTLKSAQAGKQRLDSYVFQDWNDITSQWEDIDKVEFTFDVNGNSTQEIVYDWNNISSLWEVSYKNELAYHANGTKTSQTEYFWDGTSSQWEAIFKNDYTYNANGKLSGNIEYMWDGTIWGEMYKYAYTYDSNGNMTGEFEYMWDLSLWGNSYKYEYTYNSSGNLTGDIEYQWDGSQWGNSYKSEYIYDSSGNMTQYTEYNWDGSSWAISYKSENIYDANGNMTQYIEYTWNGSLWSISFKSDFTYNNSYSFSDLILPNFITETTGILFSHMLISIIDNDWDNTSGKWLKSKTTMNYSEQNATTVSEINRTKVNLYPNPVSENLSFNLSDRNSKFTFDLIDMHGRKVLSREIKNADHLNLKGLTKGMYFYSFDLDGQKHNGKLIKE